MDKEIHINVWHKVLGITTVFFTLYILVALITFRDDIFVNRDTLSISEILLLVGFILILLFNILTIVRLLFKLRISSAGIFPDGIMLIVGILCIILLVIDKVFLDEIGKEAEVNLINTGEYIMLFVSLVIQLIFVLWVVLTARLK